MKKLITIAALLFPFIVFAQTKICTNGTLSLDLLTPEKIFHKVKTPYNSIQPFASSTIYSIDKIAIVKKPTDLDVNFNGIYYECFEATDMDGLKVECCRTVTVMQNVQNTVSPFEAFQISVFPNPVKDKHLNILISETRSFENINLVLFDMMGREIFNNPYPAGQSEITVSIGKYSLNSGIYTLTVKQGITLINKIIVLQ